MPGGITYALSFSLCFIVHNRLVSMQNASFATGLYTHRYIYIYTHIYIYTYVHVFLGDSQN